MKGKHLKPSALAVAISLIGVSVFQLAYAEQQQAAQTQAADQSATAGNQTASAEAATTEKGDQQAASNATDNALNKDQDIATLGTLVITGERKQTALPKRPVRSVYGTNTTVLDTPRAVSEVSAKQFEEDVIRSADDLVKYAPGITRGGGQNVNFAPQIRGQNSEVFQDGQRGYNVRHPSNFNAYEGADIVAGPSGVVYGPISSGGGYVNYIAKKPNFDKQQTLVSGTVGSWYKDKGYEGNYSLSIDNTGPINNELAYRVSASAQKNNDFYDNVKNNFNALFGALAWRPNDKIRVDWNISYDDYYDFNVTHGWNRASQVSVDKGQYYAGRATPIIQTGTAATTKYWSPVYESGAANSKVVGWQERVANAQNQYIATGAVQTTPLPNATADQAGRIRGWVYDPNLPGNGLVKLDDNISGRAEDKNTAKRLTSQLRVNVDLSPNWSILNSTYFQKSSDTGNSVGSFLTDYDDDLFDNRFELQGNNDFSLFGLKISNQSNTGASFRRESYTTRAANNSFNINPYDLTQNVSTKNPGDLLGLVNNTGTTGGWIGQANTPQYSKYFGYLLLPPMYSLGNGFYAEAGGFPSSGGAVYTSEGYWETTGVFTQQNFVINDVVGLNLGVNHSSIRAKIENPLAITPAQAYSDKNDFSLFSYQGSAFVKPTSYSTIYFTYDNSKSLNTGGFANVLTWGPGNKLNPLAFDSGSELYEFGVKLEPIQDQLFFTLNQFRQLRDTAPDTNGNMAQLKVEGIESSLRWQPKPQLAVGANFTKLDARYTYIVPAGFSPFGFYADNATVWGDSNGLNKRVGGAYDAAGIPEYSASAYVDYQHESGLGVNLSGWWSSKWYTNLSKTVTVPDEYNVDLALFYRQPNWTVGLNLLNLTDQRNFVNGLAGSTSEFLQPMRPFTVQGQFSYKF